MILHLRLEGAACSKEKLGHEKAVQLLSMHFRQTEEAMELAQFDHLGEILHACFLGSIQNLYLGGYGNLDEA